MPSSFVEVQSSLSGLYCSSGADRPTVCSNLSMSTNDTYLAAG